MEGAKQSTARTYRSKYTQHTTHKIQNTKYTQTHKHGWREDPFNSNHALGWKHCCIERRGVTLLIHIHMHWPWRKDVLAGFLEGSRGKGGEGGEGRFLVLLLRLNSNWDLDSDLLLDLLLNSDLDSNPNPKFDSHSNSSFQRVPCVLKMRG
jgi:hypothetical protein